MAPKLHDRRNPFPARTIPLRQVVRENLEVALPLLFVAGACTVLAFVFFSQFDPSHSTRLPLWLLSASIGVVTAAGGTTALFFGNFDEPDPEEGFAAEALASGAYVLVPRAEWERTRATAEPEPLAPAAEPEAPSWSETPATTELPAMVERLAAEFAPAEAVRPADRLAAEVDALVSELDRTAEARRPSSPARPHGVPAEVGTPAPRADTRSRDTARLDYETLLTQLEVDAAPDPGGPSPKRSTTGTGCGRCGRPIAAEESWAACTACWQAYCARCSDHLHGADPALPCPRCGAVGKYTR